MPSFSLCATPRNESIAADLSSSQVQVQVQGHSQSHSQGSQAFSLMNGVGGQSQRALFATANGAPPANALIVYPCDASRIAPVGDRRSGRYSRGSNASNGSTRSSRSSHSGGALVVDVDVPPTTAAVAVGVNGVGQAACKLDLTTATTQGVFTCSSMYTLPHLQKQNVSELSG